MKMQPALERALGRRAAEGEVTLSPDRVTCTLRIAGDMRMQPALCRQGC